MRSMLKKATGLILAAALTFSLAAPAAAAGSSRTPGSSATATAVTEVTLPQQGWQLSAAHAHHLEQTGRPRGHFCAWAPPPPQRASWPLPACERAGAPRWPPRGR